MPLGMLIYRNPQPAYYKQRKNEVTILSLVYQWNDNLREGKRIDDYLYDKGIRSVAIYGSGELGYQLSKELNNKVNIIAFIDREKKQDVFGIKNIQIDDVASWDCLKCDLIIITPMNDYRAIEKQLHKMISVETISIEEIIFDM